MAQYSRFISSFALAAGAGVPHAQSDKFAIRAVRMVVPFAPEDFPAHLAGEC
jgi:hypothetical protein